MITEYCESCAHKLHCQQKINSIFKCSDYKNYDEISLAKKRYYKFKKEADDHFEGLRDPIIDYVTELEQQVEELKKALIGCTSAMFHYDTVIKAAEQNYAVELLKKYGGTKP